MEGRGEGHIPGGADRTHGAAQELASRVPPDVCEAMWRMLAAGHDVWVVGGALRDLLLDLRAKDWDLATTATPDAVTGLFPRVFPLGIGHGTVVVHTRERDMEVTSIEGRGDAAILADLGRRDLTVNALAFAWPDGRLLDPSGGREDLARGLLRGVGNPRERYREDPLRVVRTLRFASTLGFRIERGTLDALKAEAHGLAGVAVERIREELFRLLLGKGAVKALHLALRAGVMVRVFPEIAGCGRQGTGLGRKRALRTVACVGAAPARLRVRVATLFRGMDAGRRRVRPGSGLAADEPGKAVIRPCLRRVLERFKLSRKEMHDLGLLVSTRIPLSGGRLSDEALRHLIARVGPELVPDLVDIERAERVFRREEPGGPGRLLEVDARVRRLLARPFPLTPRDLAVSGREVMEALGLSGGPEVGKVLRELHRAVLKNPGLNDHKILMDFIKKNKL